MQILPLKFYEWIFNLPNQKKVFLIMILIVILITFLKEKNSN